MSMLSFDDVSPERLYARGSDWDTDAMNTNPVFAGRAGRTALVELVIRYGNDTNHFILPAVCARLTQAEPPLNTEASIFFTAGFIAAAHQQQGEIAIGGF